MVGLVVSLMECQWDKNMEMYWDLQLESKYGKLDSCFNGSVNMLVTWVR